MGVMSMYPQFKAIILAYLPKVFQGLVAAVGDYYTWQLAEKVYGQGSNAAFTTVCSFGLFGDICHATQANKSCSYSSPP